MQKPVTPTFGLPVRATRKSTAPLRSLPAVARFMLISSLPAWSGSVVCTPWYMSGASAVKPSAANLSAMSLMWSTSPHHSWITMTPGPLPSARYPPHVPPLLLNSTISPIAVSFDR